MFEQRRGDEGHFLLEDSLYLSRGEAIKAISCWRIAHV